MLQGEWRGEWTLMLRPAGSAASPADGQHTCGVWERGRRRGPQGGGPAGPGAGGRGSRAAAEWSLRVPACLQAAGSSTAAGAPVRLTPGPLGAGGQKLLLLGAPRPQAGSPEPTRGRWVGAELPGRAGPADGGGLSVSIAWGCPPTGSPFPLPISLRPHLLATQPPPSSAPASLLLAAPWPPLVSSKHPKTQELWTPGWEGSPPT